MYPSFGKWIHSYRDLPLLLNQWTNVVRWEFKHPTPFIRTREFLWQEGHTAHATDEEAHEFVLKILDNYEAVYRELLAVPCVKGRKSEDERFAGAKNTTTVELYVPVSGRGIQGATSHHLGQNFSKMFDVWYTDEKEQKTFVHQTSWGLSTRSIGSMIMIHSDNNGLVLPPRVAQNQVVIIPIFFKDGDNKALKDKVHEIAANLRDHGIRVAVDDNDSKNPGFKFNHWEVRGTPIRLELGHKDLEKSEVKAVVRHSGEKFQMHWQALATNIEALLQDIHAQMYAKAEKARVDHTKHVENWEQFMEALDNKFVCLAPWCDTVKCEETVKNRSKEESLAKMAAGNEGEIVLTGSAKTLCIPFELGKQDFGEHDQTKCFHCGEKAKVTALWGRSY
jgi:prolyl-tRNA synthetase